MTSLRILLVEDHPSSNRTLCQLLEKHGHSVIQALTAKDALLAARTTAPFTLAIIDIGLPDDNGWNLLVKLKGVNPRLKAIAVSGYGQEADLKRSDVVGFTAHLTKPIDSAALWKAIAQVFPATAENPAPDAKSSP
jgi:CheY-like chemotaxis protein